MIASEAWPDRIEDVEHLEELLSAPAPWLCDILAGLRGDIMILGVGGKMGPTLARMARRAAPGRRVIGVARFSEPGLRDRLQSWDVECIAADLLDRQAVEALPKVDNIVYMAGRKFGSAGREDLTWAMNVFVPGLVAAAFPAARIVAFSTGCVYPYARVLEGGATEHVPPHPPAGDYANSCVGRERIFQYFSHLHGTPGRLIRLNYAIDLRYGVLHDVAAKVLAGTPIDLAMGHVNVIWQGDANRMALGALGHCTTPAGALNVSGPETVSIRRLAEALGRRLDRRPVFSGQEAETAWLVDTGEAMRLFGYPSVPLGRMIDWVADWLSRGMPSLGKETRYDVRDGVY